MSHTGLFRVRSSRLTGMASRFMSSIVSRPSDVKIVENGNKLDLVWEGDEKWRFHSIWLRHNCQCMECLSPEGQKTAFLEQSFRNGISTSFKIASAKIERESISVNWNAGKWSHTGHFPIQWLSENKYSDKKERYLPTATALPKISYLDVTETDKGLWKLLTNIKQYGMSLVHNVPTTEEGLRKVAEKIGPIQGNNRDGEISSVLCKENPLNVAYMESPFSLRSDQSFNQTPPGVMMLHSIRNDDCIVGGETILLDAYPIVEELRTKYPKHFKVLTNVFVRFKNRVFCDNDDLAETSSQGTHLEVDDLGRLVRIRWSPLFECAQNISMNQMEEYYEAYILLYEMIENSKNQIVHRLLPGELYVVDNCRVLHGRTNFKLNGGVRHMMGLFLSMDDLDVRLTILTTKLRKLGREYLYD